MNEQSIKKLALIISANCIQNSSIEKSHKNGQLSEEEINAIRKEMSDRIYTFLTYLLNKPAQDYSVMLEGMTKNLNEAWESPEIYEGFFNAQQSAAGLPIQQ